MTMVVVTVVVRVQVQVQGALCSMVMSDGHINADAVVAGPCRDVLGTWQMRLCRCQVPGARCKAGRRKGDNGRRLTRPMMAQTPDARHGHDVGGKGEGERVRVKW